MSRGARVLDLCLLAYPRARRRRDGAYLRDLALDLATVQGTPRQALSLLRGGLRARLSSRVGVVAAGASVALGLAVVVAVLVGPSESQVEARSCEVAAAGGCEELARISDSFERRGWECVATERVVERRRVVDLECRTGS